ncbi:MAG: DUF3810 domain-containing protein [Armatimonadetes bacterium]|nr:DUF3810 domain-containing protein [Armatimonadota bacterium]
MLLTSHGDLPAAAPLKPDARPRRLGWALLGAAAAAQRWAPPDWVERWFVPHVYPYEVRFLSAINVRARFSLAEVLAVALLVGGVAAILRALWRSGNRVRRLWRGLLTLLSAAGYVAFAFSLLWGLTYRRAPMARRLGMATGGTAAELASAARWLATEAARLAPPGEADRPTTLPYPPEALHARIEEAFAQTPEMGEHVRAPLGPAKPVFLSGVLSRLGLSGIYIPFTGEPNYNRLLPDAELVFAIAHEKAHQRGIGPENEANFAAFLALRASPDPYLRYCGYLSAAGYALRALRRVDPDAHAEFRRILAGRPAADFGAFYRFWQRYRGPVQRVSNRVNDAYLRANRVPGGVQSYDAVTDLLVGYHRTRL